MKNLIITILLSVVSLISCTTELTEEQKIIEKPIGFMTKNNILHRQSFLNN